MPLLNPAAQRRTREAPQPPGGIPPWLSAGMQTLAGGITGGPAGALGSALGWAAPQAAQAFGGAAGPQVPGGVRPPPPLPPPQPQGGAAAGQPGQMMMFPQGQGQGQQQDFGGMAELLKAMYQRPPNFGEQLRGAGFGSGMQGAMDRMTSLQVGNAQREAQARNMAMQYDLARRQLGSREQMGMNMLSAFSGRPLEQALRGRERVAAPPPAGAPPNWTGYTYRDVYDTQLGAAPQSPAQGSIPPSGASPGADAASNLYQQILGAAAPAAFSGQQGISGLQFASPEGQFGGATLPTPPWAGGQPGTANIGVGTAPGSVWGPQYAQQAAERVGGVSEAATPHLPQAGSPEAASGLAAQFQDFMRGAGARTMSQLGRAGEKAEAGQQLESQIAGTRLQNAMQQLMGQIYGSQMGTMGDENQLALRMLQGLYRLG